MNRDEKVEAIKDHFEDIMNILGVKWDDSTIDTPNRIAKMYVDELFYGLDESKFPKATAVENSMAYDQMIVVKDIKVHSLCEHHFVPFIGKCHVAYIPDKKVLGLSKFNRIVDFYCRRPQIQERLTADIFKRLCEILDTKNVAIFIDSEHLCVKLRGVKDQTSHTVTNQLGGKFKNDPMVRNEFLSLCR